MIQETGLSPFVGGFGIWATTLTISTAGMVRVVHLDRGASVASRGTADTFGLGRSLPIRFARSVRPCPRRRHLVAHAVAGPWRSPGRLVPVGMGVIAEFLAKLVRGQHAGGKAERIGQSEWGATEA
jgi:hypothetical protein